MSKPKYKELYHNLLKFNELQETYPTLCGNYKLDKKSWKAIVDAELNKPVPTEAASDVFVGVVRPCLENETFLLDYIRTHSPSGCEYKAQDVWKNHIKDYVDRFETDCHGNVIAFKHGQFNMNGAPSIMIEAHCDEISYIITKIDPNGLIYVHRNGGSDEAIAPSKKVLIHVNDNRTVPAVFGWIAIHIREPHIKPEKNTIFLDGGFNSAEEVRKAGVEVGQYVTYDEEPMILNDKVIGKSLDNKVGGYIIAEVMRKLHPLNLANTVMASNSVQEEVGLHGAKMVADSIAPDIVIVTDVCHDTTTPGITNKLIGDIHIGKGPVLVKGAAINGRLNGFAESQGVTHQVMACNGRGTGTDADVFTYSNGGTPTILIKMPLRYMHTTVEMVSISDINDAIELMFRTVVGLSNNLEFAETLNKTPNKFNDEYLG